MDLKDFPSQTRPNLPQHLTIILLFSVTAHKEKTAIPVPESEQESLCVILFPVKAAPPLHPAPAHL